MTNKEEVLKLLKGNSMDLISLYLFEFRPQNTIIQTTNLLSLLANHLSARQVMFTAAREFLMKKFNINTLTDKNNKIISYF